MSKITMGSRCVLLRFETQAAWYPICGLKKPMHIGEQEEQNCSFQPRITPIRKAVQNPFDLLNNAQNTKARSKPQNRSLQKGTRCSHYAKNSRRKDSYKPAQSTETCHASFLLFFSLTKSHSFLVTTLPRGEKGFVAVTVPHENFTGTVITPHLTLFFLLFSGREKQQKWAPCDKFRFFGCSNWGAHLRIKRSPFRVKSMWRCLCLCTVPWSVK